MKIAKALSFIFLLSSLLTPPQLIGQVLATTRPLTQISIGDYVSLGSEQFIKLNNNGLLMMTSTLSCPHGKIIAGQHVKCFECPADSTYDSTHVTCTCTDSSSIFDINHSTCILNPAAIPADADTLNCTSPVAFMDSWNNCSSLATHETVCLADRRDYRTYRVRKLADGNCWMVDSLKFGGNYGDTDGCSANAGVGNYGNGGSSDATKAQETFATGYYGHCRAIPGTYSDDYYNDTRAYSNYLYDWVAAMQSTLAYTGSSTTFTHPHQGICPSGWHLPSENNSINEYNTLALAYNDQGAQLLDATKGNFTLSGYVDGSSGSLEVQGSVGSIWSSADSYDDYNVYGTSIEYDGTYQSDPWLKEDGLAVRCLKD
ncbi:hypothetical protein IJJ27_03640 [bacterium]|nr:hypothetical protein [bacterium]